MKKILALLFVLLLGYLLITHLESNDAFVKFGEVNLIDRVSDKYVHKNVNSDEDNEVKYGGEYEEGSANIVTSIVANYRSFDTLGEVTVLFISAIGVAMLLGSKKSNRLTLNFHSNFILKVGSKALFGIILMSGVYMAIHGHLTPGGGFPGGSMIAAAILLLYLSDDNYRMKVKNFKVIESIAGMAYVIIGLVGLILGGYFLQNFLDNGSIGELLSAGVIPIVYVLIGLKVGSEISTIIDHFLTEEGA